MKTRKKSYEQFLAIAPDALLLQALVSKWAPSAGPCKKVLNDDVYKGLQKDDFREGLHNLNVKGDNTCVRKILQSDWTIFFNTKVDFFPWNVHNAESGIL